MSTRISNDDNVIVTGVAGFIGSHLAEKLLDSNNKVIGIDCFNENYSKEIKLHNLHNCKKNGNFPKQEGDVFRTDAGIEKASKILGYNPGISLEQGLRK